MWCKFVLGSLIWDSGFMMLFMVNWPKTNGSLLWFFFRPIVTHSCFWHSVRLCISQRRSTDVRKLSFHTFKGTPFDYFWFLLKVSKSQNHFFLKLHCPQNERKIRQNSARWSKGKILSNISFVFGAMEFQEKMILRFTDL